VTWFQDPPRLPDAWTSDRILRESLRWHLGLEAFARAEDELAAMGACAASAEVLELAATAEREPPELIAFSPWGERVDEIRVSPAYSELGRIGVAAGVTALPYESNPYEEKGRLVAAGLLAMWGPSSALFSCPVAMTDGAARTLLEHGHVDDVEVVAKLTSRDPNLAWTSGQWMTETTGGSDVSQTGTIARVDGTGNWHLYGTKWFTSSITSETALTLARPEGAGAGSGALALFRVDRRFGNGRPNLIQIRRLKDKLGTRALPTAELELRGALAHPVGDPLEGGGVKKMATMLNATRIHNAIGSAAALGRGLAWARSYAQVRKVHGAPLNTLPAHQATLADLAVDYAAALELALRCAELLGRVEHRVASRSEALLLRSLTPVAKLATAKWAVAGVAEAMESVGGVGYCEDSTIPALVRNTHVMPIWEGTTNVLALDFLRSIEQRDHLDALLQDASACVEEATNELVTEPVAAVKAALKSIEHKVAELGSDPWGAEAFARTMAMGVANTYACARLCLQGAQEAASGRISTAAMAGRLAVRGLLPQGPAGEPDVILDEEIRPRDPAGSEVT
jgi:acyl-CoA dehydrogenase